MRHEGVWLEHLHVEMVIQSSEVKIAHACSLQSQAVHVDGLRLRDTRSADCVSADRFASAPISEKNKEIRT